MWSLAPCKKALTDGDVFTALDAEKGFSSGHVAFTVRRCELDPDLKAHAWLVCVSKFLNLMKINMLLT